MTTILIPTEDHDAMPAVLAEEFGLEVSTAKGHWRTLRHPGQRSLAALTCPIGRPAGGQ